MSAPCGAFTVDVEDWFQVHAYARVFARAQWDGLPRRVEANTERLLALLAEARVVGTFFTLGWVAERHPALVRRIVAAGHELASHGYWHERVDAQTPAAFHADVLRARLLLEDGAGVAVHGFRAPTFSMGPRTPWAWSTLARAGYRYSSSVYPVRHDLYGAPGAPRAPHRPDPLGVLEIPMTTARLLGRTLACAGGGWFRLLPYITFRALLRRRLAADPLPALFYTHPWEVDPGQPLVPEAALRSRLRHRVNLAATEPRLVRLLREFSWGRVDAVFAADLAAG